MGTPHSWASQLATLAAAPLAVLELHWATQSSHVALAATGCVLVVITVACLGRLLKDNQFEARLALAVLSLLQLGLGLLTATIGLPGQAAQRGDAAVTSTIAVATVVLVALALDGWLRQPGRPGEHPPATYAR